MKSNKVLSHFRLPKNIIDALSKQAKKDGKTKTQILTEALQVKLFLKAGFVQTRLLVLIAAFAFTYGFLLRLLANN